jgi:hypothetical protein
MRLKYSKPQLKYCLLTDGVGELAVSGAVIVGFDDDGLLTGVAAGKHDHHLTILDDTLRNNTKRTERS